VKIRPAAVLPLFNHLRMANWFFCLTVWLSSLAAIWMSRGWIGLFVSGQVLSAGAFLFKGLGRRPPSCVSSSNRVE
jgi:hypothetical protein